MTSSRYGPQVALASLDSSTTANAATVQLKVDPIILGDVKNGVNHG